MNPTQTPGGLGAGTPGTPPMQPQPPRPDEALVRDTPDAAFGFADESQNPPQQLPVPAPTPVSAPAPATRPFAPPPLAVPARPPQTSPQPAPTNPMPADVLPPQRVPAVPTLAAQPVIATATPPAPSPQAPFDPAKVPVTASSTPVNPLTATFTPAGGQHVPDEITARIASTPMQNSSDITQRINKGTAKNWFKTGLSITGFIAAIFVAAFLINQFIFQSYYVEGTSMTPTLQNNDRLIISKVERTLAAVQGKPYIPERGQIVVLDSSIVGLNGQKEQLIKRAIGLPGDHVHIEGGNVIISNSQHPNGYDVTKDLGLTNLQPTYVDSTVDLTVPNGQVFVMGDNREQGGSYDSRVFGPIDGDKIQGRLWGRILPLDKAQLF